MIISFIDFNFCLTETPTCKDKYLRNTIFCSLGIVCVDQVGQHYVVEGELDFNIQKT